MNERPYPLPMLPDVDYQQFDDSFDSLVDLEFGVLGNLTEFLEGLKKIFLRRHMSQVHELVCAHLCAYVGAFTIACVDLTEGKKLEPAITALLKKHAMLAYSTFTTLPLDFAILTDNSPGSIVAQTIRLKKLVGEFLEELADHRSSKVPRYKKQDELFCPQDELFKLMLPRITEQKIVWQKTLRGKSLNHVINQMAIQIGWLIGYFSYSDQKSPKDGQYLEYSEPLIGLYIEKTAHVVQAFFDRQHAEMRMKEGYAPEDPDLQPVIKEMSKLSEIINTTQSPAIVTDFQKQTVIVDAALKKELVTLMLEGRSPYVVMLSLYYFWFRLEALFHGIDISDLDNYSPMDDMKKITDVILKTILVLPKPELTAEQSKLADHMDLLMSRAPSQELSKPLEKDKLDYETSQTIARIAGIISDFTQIEYHPEVLANVLFSQWLRLSILCERQSEYLFQNIDHYFKEVITNVRQLITQLLEKEKR